jgi:hypothetical protein
MRGQLLWFNETKNFGFIRTEEDERLYVHRSGFMPGQVSFEREVPDTDPIPRAVFVSVVEDVPAQRARRRARSFRVG